jgi:hypothetical protein
MSFSRKGDGARVTVYAQAYRAGRRTQLERALEIDRQPSYEPRAVRGWLKATREKFEQMLSGI